MPNNYFELERKWSLLNKAANSDTKIDDIASNTYTLIDTELTEAAFLPIFSLNLIQSEENVAKIHNFYFDTVDQHLHKHKIAFRLRLVLQNLAEETEFCLQSWYMTVKGPKNKSGERFELELLLEQKKECKAAKTSHLDLTRIVSDFQNRILSSIDQQIKEFIDRGDFNNDTNLGILSELEKLLLAKQEFIPYAWCTFMRVYKNFTYNCKQDIFKIELAYDKGWGGTSTYQNPIQEIELEFKKGDKQVFTNLCEYLEDKASLVPQEESKLAYILNTNNSLLETIKEKNFYAEYPLL